MVHSVGAVDGEVAYETIVTHSISCYVMRSRRARRGAMGSNEELLNELGSSAGQ